MKILVISDLFPYVTGGAEIQATRLITSWLDQGHEVICFGRRMKKNGSVKIGNHTVEVRRIKTSKIAGRPGKAISYSLSLAKLLMSYQQWPNVIYCRFLGEAALTVSVLKQFRWLRVPMVATPAGMRNGDIQFLHTIPATKKLINLLNKHCDAINLIAPGMKQELVEAGFTEKSFSYIPNGIPIHPLYKPPPSGNIIQFIAIGRLTKQKGYDLLLRAISLLRDRLQPGQVTIIGSGPDEKKLHTLAEKLDISDLIRWTGELDQKGVKELLNQSDIFLLPSRWEGMSNAALEAMERGLAPILSSCGGIDTYVDRDTGWVIPQDNVNELAGAIKKALTLPPTKIREIGDNARSLILNNFEMKKVANCYIELFKNL